MGKKYWVFLQGTERHVASLEPTIQYDDPALYDPGEFSEGPPYGGFLHSLFTSHTCACIPQV